MKMEVLSPVGSAESLEAALRCGCDAVYLGAKRFSARRNAANFDLDELKETLAQCHIHRVKVYVTVNILIKQSELEEVLTLVEELYQLGVDGLIVQDLGLAMLIHEHFPQIELHGSTQMSIHNPAALPLLKRMGFKRIVMAREMNREQIRVFCDAAKDLEMEVEMFVHGALCMSVSGQCLLSAMIGSRSGNRGLCAQPCRLPFKVPNGTGYDLSLKDLSLFDKVDELKELGITSLKIEGRMKRPEYVAMATRCCRQAVDGEPYDVSVLKSVFSRSGFSSGYYEGRLSKDNFGIRTKEDVDASAECFSQIHGYYRNERQCVPLNCRIVIHADQPIRLYCQDLMIEGEAPQKATKRPSDAEGIREALGKLGGTVYYLKQCDVEMDEGLFVYNGLINNLRRQLCQQLDQKAAQPVKRTMTKPQIEQRDREHYLQKTYVRLHDLEQCPKDLSGVDGLIVPIDGFAIETELEIIPEIPRWMAQSEWVENCLEKWQKRGIQRCYCNNLAAAELVQSRGLGVLGGNFLNFANSQSLSLDGVAEKTLSAELSLKEIEKTPSLCAKGIIGYGRLPLMLLLNCPLKNGRPCSQCDHHGQITDRLGVHFPIRCQYGASELFNSAPIYLADKLEEIRQVDFMILYFTIETRTEVQEVLQSYRRQKAPQGDYTRGLYYRSVL